MLYNGLKIRTEILRNSCEYISITDITSSSFSMLQCFLQETKSQDYSMVMHNYNTNSNKTH